MRAALADLQLAHGWVVYPGAQAYPLYEHPSVIPVDDIPDICAGLVEEG